MTGYLTQASLPESEQTLGTEEKALMIPNAEIKEIFETTIIKWMSDTVIKWDRVELFHAIWKNDFETITKEMEKLLWNTISYYDYKEDFYHAFLTGVLMGAGDKIESNKEHGLGRPELVIKH